MPGPIKGGRSTAPVVPPKPKTQKIKADATPKEKKPEERKLSSDEVKDMRTSKKGSVALRESAVKQSLDQKIGGSGKAAKQQEPLTKTKGQEQIAKPYTHGSVYERSARDPRKMDHGPSLPKAAETDPKNRNWAVRDELNSLITGFRKAAQTTRFFHATRTKNLSGKTGIQKKGLEPRHGGKGAAKGSEQFEAQSAKKVHITDVHAAADDYRRFFKTGKMRVMGADGKFQDKTTKPSSAEMLKISLPAEQRKKLQPDPDDRQASTLNEKIKPEYIRKEGPVKPGKLDAQKHIKQQVAENQALLSNLDPQFKKLFDAKFPEGKSGSEEQLRRETAIQMLKQAVKSEPGSFF